MSDLLTIRHYYLPWFAGLLIMALVLSMPPEQPSANASTLPTALISATTPVVSEATRPLVTTMPFFPGCQHLTGKDKRVCSSEQMYEYIYNQVGYPAGNSTHRTAGIVVVGFLVSHDGLVRDPKLLQAPGHGRGEDALRIINNMIAEEVRWEPATRRDSPISSRMTITIQYNMVWAGAKQEQK